MRPETSQILLIISGLAVTALFGVFLHREMFPEYKIYQNDYIALEEFRSTYTNEPPPPFQTGVKQIVLEREDKGPATVDRCTSCHVALQIPYFSPTKIAYDLNGNIVRDENGHPLKVHNENYIWEKLDTKIAELRDAQVLAHLKREGQLEELNSRLAEAAKYEELKTAHVGENVYDVSKVLKMHPLMGNETYPFEYHPLEEYGCTSCHNGNGRGLVTDKAHGPVFDGQYEIEDIGHSPNFTERDFKNDPRFAQMFNHKPGEDLIFQTEPLFVGALIQAKCVQCHKTSDIKVAEAQNSISTLVLRRQDQTQILTAAYENEVQSVADLLKIHQMINTEGYFRTLEQIQERSNDYTLPPLKLEQLASQLKYLKEGAEGLGVEKQAQEKVLGKINSDLVTLLGSEGVVKKLESLYQSQGDAAISPFIKEHQHAPQTKGLLFSKKEALDHHQDLFKQAEEAHKSFSRSATNQILMSTLTSDIDELTRDYQRGKELYLSQACYTCHRISGFSRGGVGPDLTHAGDIYPWYMKRKLSWPQGDLPTSTMPNMRLDPHEIEGIMTFLLSQKGNNKSVSKTDYQSAIQAWDAGRKMSWEKPIPPDQIFDLRNSMTLYATEGCAACHRLKGFESNVGFAVEKDSPSFDDLYKEQQWFTQLFPEVVHFSLYDEEVPGSELVATIEKNSDVIDKKIVDNVRKDSILEEIERNHPDVIESFYSPFRFAARAKNDYYQSLISQEKDPQKRAQIQKEWSSWQERVHRVLMVYIQTYGLGRLIGPHLSYSGIYRSDQWMLEHFHNPTAEIPRSIMPVFPFDDTKFYALIHLIDTLSIQNRNTLHQIWNGRGFNPEEAFNMLCAQCHGIDRIGNGVLAEWIYPIPKNLRNQDFLRNLTKEMTIESIQHGIKGTPMPPWGEVSSKIHNPISPKPVLSKEEISHLVDWLFSSLPGGEVIRKTADVPKWHYTPEDIQKELKHEGGVLERESGDNRLNESNSLKEGQNKKGESPLSLILKRQQRIYSGLTLPNSKDNEPHKSEVEEIFDVVPNPADPESHLYYIKKEYYTPYNLAKGRDFFLLNCAVCHGTEGDGSGVRAQAMQEAKPRALTNLEWVNSRDDLRLLRSIKYGVPGTSMTPWGDLTSSLQRIQLAMFIRSLTKERGERNQLMQALFETFDSQIITLEISRIENGKKIAALQEQEQQLEKEDLSLTLKENNIKNTPQELLSNYQKRFQINKELHQLEEKDRHVLDLKMKVQAERELYLNLGLNLIDREVSPSTLQTYFDLIRLNANRYSLEGNGFKANKDEQRAQKIRSTANDIASSLAAKITDLERRRKIIEGKIATAQQREELLEINGEIEAYKKLKAKLITDVEQALRLSHQIEIETIPSGEVPNSSHA